MIERILKLMKIKGITATTLSHELGLSTSAVTDWKKGKSKPTSTQIVAMANFFNVSTDFILLGKEPEQTEKQSFNNAFNHNSHSTITITNGEKHSRPMDDFEQELFRIYQNLSIKDKSELLQVAYKIESKEDKNDTNK